MVTIITDVRYHSMKSAIDEQNLVTTMKYTNSM